MLTFKQFNTKERIFLSLCWMAKSTIQASFCGYVLFLGRSKGNAVIIRKGQLFVTAGMMMIAVMAPIGAIICENLGPKLLSKEDNNGDITHLVLKTAESENLVDDVHKKRGTTTEMPQVKELLNKNQDKNNLIL